MISVITRGCDSPCLDKQCSLPTICQEGQAGLTGQVESRSDGQAWEKRIYDVASNPEELIRYSYVIPLRLVIEGCRKWIAIQDIVNNNIVSFGKTEEKKLIFLSS